MTQAGARRLAWALLAAAFVFTVLHLSLGWVTKTIEAHSAFDVVLAFASAGVTASFGVPGVLIVSRQPRNVIGWLLIAIPLVAQFAFSVGDYATLALVNHAGSLPAGRWAAWIDRWDIVPTLCIFIPLFLFFSDGRLPSRRWRPVLWLAVGAPALATISFALTPGRMTGSFADLTKVRVVNPLGLDALAGPVHVLTVLGGFGSLIAAVAAGVSLVVRFRTRTGDERQQIKWLAFVGAAVMVEMVVTFAISGALGDRTALGEAVGNWGFGLIFFTVTLGIPAACLIAVFKYRLYDLGVVVNKTLVYGALAAFITAVYVAIVVGIGAIVGQGSSKPNLGLSILATAVVAVAFQPVRARVQHLANRLVYGARATPYEVLSEFASRMGGAYASDDLLPRMARILAEGTGAAEAGVWLVVGDEVRPAAAWPGHDDLPDPVRLDGNEILELPGGPHVYPVHHHGELLGALSLVKTAGDRIGPAEDELASDLASQAGLVLRNVRLTEELLQRLEELRASRQRIVTAQDQERRRLERNIHDGAQQQLVALAVKVRLARSLTGKDPLKAEAMLAGVESELAAALGDLRDLARGIYPPLLADRGLVAALEAQSRRAAVPTTVVSEGVGRYEQDHEGAVYFCVLEALQNVAKYAGATQAEVRLAQENGYLSFAVTDDGRGFDPATARSGTGLQGMADRLVALGGEIDVRSAPGAGTSVIGRVPARTREGTG
jgi:signal transduction histidine kinase